MSGIVEVYQKEVSIDDHAASCTRAYGAQGVILEGESGATHFCVVCGGELIIPKTDDKYKNDLAIAPMQMTYVTTQAEFDQWFATIGSFSALSWFKELVAGAKMGSGYDYFVKKRSKEGLNEIDEIVDLEPIAEQRRLLVFFDQVGLNVKADGNFFNQAIHNWSASHYSKVSAHAHIIKSAKLKMLGYGFVKAKDHYGRDTSESLKLYYRPNKYLVTGPTNYASLDVQSDEIAKRASQLRLPDFYETALALIGFEYGFNVWESHIPGDVQSKVKKIANTLADSGSYWGSLDQKDSLWMESMEDDLKNYDLHYVDGKVDMARLRSTWNERASSIRNQLKKCGIRVQGTDFSRRNDVDDRTFEDYVALVEFIASSWLEAKDTDKENIFYSSTLVDKVRKMLNLNLSRATRTHWDLKNPNNLFRYWYFCSCLCLLMERHGVVMREVTVRRLSRSATQLVSSFEHRFDPQLPGLNGQIKTYYPMRYNTCSDGRSTFLVTPCIVNDANFDDEKRIIVEGNKLLPIQEYKPPISYTDVELVEGKVPSGKIEVSSEAKGLILRPGTDAYCAEANAGERVILKWVVPFEHQSFPRHTLPADPDLYLDDDAWKDGVANRGYTKANRAATTRFIHSLGMNGEVRGVVTKRVAIALLNSSIRFRSRTNELGEKAWFTDTKRTDIIAPKGVEPTILLSADITVEKISQILTDAGIRDLPKETIDHVVTVIQSPKPTQNPDVDSKPPSS